MRKKSNFLLTALLFCVVLSVPTKTSAEGTERHYTEGYIYKYDAMSRGIEIVEYRGTDKIVEVPERIDNFPVTVIGAYAFTGNPTWAPEQYKMNEKIREIILPETMLEIKKDAFRDCKKLERISLPENLKMVGESAFSSCLSLREINLPSGLTELSEGLFSNCSALEKIEIPKNILKINTYAFSQAGLKEIWFEQDSKLQKIDREAFTSCYKLTEIKFPDSLREIETQAFERCSNLKKVKFGKNSELRQLHTNVFMYCKKLSEATIPKGVTKLNACLFSYCKSLKKIIFKGKPPKMADKVFVGMNPKTTLKVPKKYKAAYEKRLKKKQGYKKTMKIV